MPPRPTRRIPLPLVPPVLFVAPLLTALLLLAGAGPLAAQIPAPFLESFEPRAIGPATMSGRTVSLAVYEEDPAIFYAASASGGLLKTVNGGTSWTNVFDRQGTVSIGAVAIQQDDPDVVWVGTGEANNRQSSSWGDGVYKSTDGGESWEHVGLRETHHVGAIVVDPRNPDIVYVAALGRLWGANPERGVFKTTNGGRSWEHVLQINEDTGVVDLVMDPTDPNTLYAAAYQRRRTGWGFNGGGPHGGIHKSTDGGRTWRKLTEGLPTGDIGRIGLDIYRSDPRILYATVEATEGQSGVFRSDDRGESWTKKNDYNPRPMYFSKVRIDPNDDQRIYVLGVRLAASDDGFETFEEEIAPQVHLDHHAFWINPANSRHLIDANDGGTWVSRDRGENWEHFDNYPLGQFYSVALDMQQPYHVFGGMQDNASWGGPSAVRDRPGIANEDWYQMLSCDGEAMAVDPFDMNLVYTNCQNGRIVRYDRATGERKPIQPQPAEGEDPYRWNWTSPIVASRHMEGTLYTAANRVFVSRDRGHSWSVISPDLTTQTDREALEIMGVRGEDIVLARNDGMANFGNITALDESPMRAGLLYAGTDDGKIHVTRDGGATWTDLTANLRGVPPMLQVSRLTPSAFREGTVYATIDGHRSNDMRPYVFASDDYGTTWRPISAGLPEGSVYVIREDPKNPDLLHLGTEFALFSSSNRGANWTRWGSFPTVAVYDLAVHPRENDLVLGTHGRSMLVFDDISPLQQLTPAVAAAPSHLFQVSRPAIQFIPNENSWFLGGRTFHAPNPEFGAYLHYHLASGGDSVSLTVRDPAGTVVREMRGPGEAGLHRVVWDLRGEPAGPMGTGLASQLNFGQRGPFVIPGRYTVTLSGRGAEQQTSVLVEGDPLVTLAPGDRYRLFEMITTLTTAQRTMATVMERINAMEDGEDKDRIREQAQGVQQQVNGLKGELIGSQSPPTVIQMDRYERAQRGLEELLPAVDRATREEGEGAEEAAGAALEEAA